jgi:hypothetical protein
MKKTYSKPDIFFEDFSLSTNIAAGCELFPTDYIGDTFVVEFGGNILLSAGPHCTSAIQDGKNEFNNLCYHVPFEDFNVFMS